MTQVSCRTHWLTGHTDTHTRIYTGEELNQEHSLWTDRSGCPSWTEPSGPPFLWRVFCCRRWRWRTTFSPPFCSQSDREAFVNKVNEDQTHVFADSHKIQALTSLCSLTSWGLAAMDMNLRSRRSSSLLRESCSLRLSCRVSRACSCLPFTESSQKTREWWKKPERDCL